MPVFTDNMQNVAKWGDVLPEAWYHVRIEKGELRDSENTPGAKVWCLWLKVQTEPSIGRVIFVQCSLQAHALALLKAFYSAVGYNPGPEGHDPEKINGSECYVKVEVEKYQGQDRMKVPPYGVRSMQDGPGA